MISKLFYIKNTYKHRTFLIIVLCFLTLGLSAQVNKIRGKKIYLDHADKLYHNQGERPDIQVLKGKVRLRYKDMKLSCDSAYLNEKQNTFEAFGNVDVRRKDGTHLTCRRLYYDEYSQMIQARKKVYLRKGWNSLKCDSLDYDMNSKTAKYFDGRGKLTYRGGIIIANEGDYNLDSHDANFYGNVFIRTPKYKITTPEAHGNTQIEQLHIVGKSVIRTNRGEVIHTNDATYNGQSDNMELVGFSTIKSRYRDIEGENIKYNNRTGQAYGQGKVKIYDKVNRRRIFGDEVHYNSKTGLSEGTGNVKIIDYKEDRTITGDNVIYNSKTSYSEGHGKVKIIDGKKKRIITGEHLIYNSKTHIGEGKGKVYYVDNLNKYAFNGDYIHYTDSAAIAYGGAPGPLAREFKHGDTIYIHADTVTMKAYNINTPKMYRKIFGLSNVRTYRTDFQSVCGFFVYNTKDSCLTLYQEPIVWHENQQILGDSIKSYMNDSTIRDAYVFGNALSVEQLKDKEHFNQLTSNKMSIHFIKGIARKGEAIGNVLAIFYPINEKDSSLVGLNYLETDTMRMYIDEYRKLDKIWTNKFNSTLYPITQIPADKSKLPNFRWYDKVRPKDKNDIFRAVARKDENDIRHKAVMPPPSQKILRH